MHITHKKSFIMSFILFFSAPTIHLEWINNSQGVVTVLINLHVKRRRRQRGTSPLKRLQGWNKSCTSLACIYILSRSTLIGNVSPVNSTTTCLQHQRGKIQPPGSSNLYWILWDTNKVVWVTAIATKRLDQS